jgi:hypothetical protein
VTRKERSIEFREARLLGIGRVTCCAVSPEGKPGILVGGAKGLFHLSGYDSHPRRLRKYPVGYVVSGESGVVLYEDAKDHGRIVILGPLLEELRAESALARKINPVAMWKGRVILFKNGAFESFSPSSGETERVARFAQTHTMTPLWPVESGFEFMASLREPSWPTSLYRLVVRAGRDGSGDVQILAKAEDPVMSRQFMRLREDRYLLIPQGVPVFLIYKVFDGKPASIRTWELLPLPAEAQPVGLIRKDRDLIAACSDCLLRFELGEEYGAGGRARELNL